MNLKSFDDGFSLIEVAIALAVMGVVAGLALPPLLSILQINKIKTTEMHQEAVMTALAAYTLRTGNLPCPANSLNPGLTPERCEGSEQCIGTVPYQTLGIPEKYAKDGFQQFMVYAIEPKFSFVSSKGVSTREGVQMKNTKADIACRAIELNLSLTVINENNQEILVNKNDENFPAVVLLSQGSSANDSAMGPDENINIDNNLTFVDRPYSTNPKNLHRHILKWATRDFLLGHYGQFSCPAHRATEPPSTPPINYNLR